MNTIRKLTKIANVELRIIKTAAQLETLLRKESQDESLGEMVQDEERFCDGGFLKDLNFALGVRNDIAHARRTPSNAELHRASNYLLAAVGRIANDGRVRSKNYLLRAAIALGFCGGLILFAIRHSDELKNVLPESIPDSISAIRSQ